VPSTPPIPALRHLLERVTSEEAGDLSGHPASGRTKFSVLLGAGWACIDEGRIRFGLDLPATGAQMGHQQIDLVDRFPSLPRHLRQPSHCECRSITSDAREATILTRAKSTCVRKGPRQYLNRNGIHQCGRAPYQLKRPRVDKPYESLRIRRTGGGGRWRTIPGASAGTLARAPPLCRSFEPNGQPSGTGAFATTT
jgi:hypothetical protein